MDDSAYSYAHSNPAPASQLPQHPLQLPVQLPQQLPQHPLQLAPDGAAGVDTSHRCSSRIKAAQQTPQSPTPDTAVAGRSHARSTPAPTSQLPQHPLQLPGQLPQHPPLQLADGLAGAGRSHRTGSLTRSAQQTPQDPSQTLRRSTGMRGPAQQTPETFSEKSRIPYQQWRQDLILKHDSLGAGQHLSAAL